MSMPGRAFPPGRNDAGQTVARFPTYDAAQKAVSALIAADVPAREIAIVGIGIRSVERITGRLGYAAAARAGAVNGILIGLLLSAFFVLGSPTVQIQAFLGVMLVGVAVGMLFNLLLYVIMRRRRDFASVMQFVADEYDVTVAAGNVARARDLLGAAAVSAPAAAPRPVDDTPPRYGQRVAEPSPETPDTPAETSSDPLPPQSAGDSPDRPA